MANTYHQIYLQLVFGVKYRRALLDKSWRSKVQGVMGNLINETGCKTIIVNGVEDHIHCFVGLRPAVSVSDLMKTVKAKSSLYINNLSLTSERFECRRAMASFHTGGVMWILFINIFRTRKCATKNNHLGMNT